MNGGRFFLPVGGGYSARARSGQEPSVGALDAEIDEFVEGGLLRAVVEDTERVACDGAVMASALHRIVPGGMFLHQVDGVFHVAFGLVQVFQGAAPEIPVVVVAAPERQNNRKADLAFPEVVADGFPQR